LNCTQNRWICSLCFQQLWSFLLSSQIPKWGLPTLGEAVCVCSVRVCVCLLVSSVSCLPYYPSAPCNHITYTGSKYVVDIVIVVIVIVGAVIGHLVREAVHLHGGRVRALFGPGGLPAGLCGRRVRGQVPARVLAGVVARAAARV
jgi:hypothetical protein